MNEEVKMALDLRLARGEISPEEYTKTLTLLAPDAKTTLPPPNSPDGGLGGVALTTATQGMSDQPDETTETFKKCEWCGKEHPDEATACSIYWRPLVSEKRTQAGGRLDQPTPLDPKWKKSRAQQATAPSSPTTGVRLRNPAPYPTAKSKVGQGFAGCLGVVVILLFISWIAGTLKNDDTNSAQDSRDIFVKATAGPDNSGVQRLKGLSSSNAYKDGWQTGAADFASLVAKTAQMGGDIEANLRDLRDLKNDWFDLVASQEKVNGVDPAVLSRYKDGWNFGWDAHRTR